jgi:hypothetical protein
MELLDGASLAEVIGLTGPMPPGRVTHILHQASTRPYFWPLRRSPATVTSCAHPSRRNSRICWIVSRWWSENGSRLRTRHQVDATLESGDTAALTADLRARARS